jgi:hypothetical protein
MIAEDQGNFGAELFVDDSRFLVHHSDFVTLGYYFRGASNKPFLAALVGPSGRNMVDAQPPDHAHHRGVWWGHGDVNGVDFYLEVPKPREHHPLGTIVHVEFAEIVDAAPRFGFTERLEWRDPSGTVLVHETRSLSVDLSADDRYPVDLESTYTAAQDLTLGDTKESTMPGVRLAERLTVNGGGHMRNSRGQVGEQQCFGQPAEWVDHSVARSGLWWKERTEGIAIFDHPSNPHHPAVWFTRDYGPQSPYEGNHFVGAGSMPAGESLRLRHRILVHEGDAAGADVAAAYADYCDDDPR